MSNFYLYAENIKTKKMIKLEELNEKWEPELQELNRMIEAKESEEKIQIQQQESNKEKIINESAEKIYDHYSEINTNYKNTESWFRKEFSSKIAELETLSNYHRTIYDYHERFQDPHKTYNEFLFSKFIEESNKLSIDNEKINSLNNFVIHLNNNKNIPECFNSSYFISNSETIICEKILQLIEKDNDYGKKLFVNSFTVPLINEVIFISNIRFLDFFRNSNNVNGFIKNLEAQIEEYNYAIDKKNCFVNLHKNINPIGLVRDCEKLYPEKSIVDSLILSYIGAAIEHNEHMEL